jgi:hypothetical protein
MRKGGAGFGQVMLHVVKVAVVDIGGAAVDVQPGAAVEDAPAPASDLGDLAWPAEGPDAAWRESTAVVHGEIPVAVRAVVSSGARAAEGNGLNAGQAGQAVPDIVAEGIVVVGHGHQGRTAAESLPGHEAMTAGTGSGATPPA